MTKNSGVDLIIGTKTMTELGLILDFKERMTAIEEIKFPMQDIKELPPSNKIVLCFNNGLANDEANRAKLGTQRVVTILYVKYEKTNLPEIIENNCPHLSSKEQVKLLELCVCFALRLVR